MMIKERALIANIKSAYKDGSLTIEAREEKKEEGPVIWMIGGTKWEYTAAENDIPRKVKATILETTGLLPEVGIKYTCGKESGNQVTMRDTTRSTWESMIDSEQAAELTGIVFISGRLGAIRFVKCFERKDDTFIPKIIGIYERLANMILDIDFNDEDEPVYTDYKSGHIVVSNGEEQIVIYETDCVSDQDVVNVMKKVNEVL